MMDTVEFEGRQMKLCWMESPGLKWLANKNSPIWGQPVQYVIFNFHLYRYYIKITLSPCPPYVPLLYTVYLSVQEEIHKKR